MSPCAVVQVCLRFETLGSYKRSLNDKSFNANALFPNLCSFTNKLMLILTRSPICIEYMRYIQNDIKHIINVIVLYTHVCHSGHGGKNDIAYPQMSQDIYFAF